MESKIKEWVILSTRLKNIKEDELELRKEITEYILADKLKGSKTSTIGNYVMTATAKINNKIDKEVLQSMWYDLSKAEKACVKFNPSIIDKEYKNLDPSSNIHRAIDTKPSTPTLKLKSLKED